MLNRVAVLSAALALSAGAQAGIIQYNFNQVTWSDGGSLEGFFVQDEESRKILHYYFHLAGGDGPLVGYVPEDPFSNLTGAWLGHYPTGPTHFAAYAHYMGGYSTVGFQFQATEDANVFKVAGWNEEIYQPDPNDVDVISRSRRTALTGTVSAGDIDPWVADYLANLPPDAPWRIADLTPLPPAQQAGTRAMEVPEPASLALMMAGLGAAALSRRRRRSH